MDLEEFEAMKNVGVGAVEAARIARDQHGNIAMINMLRRVYLLTPAEAKRIMQSLDGYGDPFETEEESAKSE